MNDFIQAFNKLGLEEYGITLSRCADRDALTLSISVDIYREEIINIINMEDLANNLIRKLTILRWRAGIVNKKLEDIAESSKLKGIKVELVPPETFIGIGGSRNE